MHESLYFIRPAAPSHTYMSCVPELAPTRVRQQNHRSKLPIKVVSLNLGPYLSFLSGPLNITPITREGVVGK